MRVGAVVLPTEPWAAARPTWEHLDASGVASVWVYDHVRWGGWPKGAWFGGWPTLAAAATATRRVRLGTLVTSPNFRHPVPLALDAMTLDHLSGGRFDLGVGAGSSGPDATVLGGSPWQAPERAARFAEFLELLDGLLTGAATTSEGRWYSASDARLEPGCVQRPRLPFTVAAAGPRSLALAARFAARWVTIGPAGPGPRTPDAVHAAVASQCEQLDAACAAAGRDTADLERVLLHMGSTGGELDSVGAVEDLFGRYGELGFAEVILHAPRAAEPFAGDWAVFDEVAARHAV